MQTPIVLIVLTNLHLKAGEFGDVDACEQTMWTDGVMNLHGPRNCRCQEEEDADRSAELRT